MGRAIKHHGQRIEGGSRPLFERPWAKNQASPREARMTAKYFVAAVAMSLAVAGQAFAAESVAIAAASAAVVDIDNGQVTPRISKSVPRSVRMKLEDGFELATERVREVPECRGLFERLGADGVEMLRTTMYYTPEKYIESGVGRRSYAFTEVGVRVTWVCRRFAELSDYRAAMVVIHEALHYAGLTEAPLDPDGMRSREINTMVAKACDL
jgi:hypothetical protein